jgi:hypothetical protein
MTGVVEKDEFISRTWDSRSEMAKNDANLNKFLVIILNLIQIFLNSDFT